MLITLTEEQFGRHLALAAELGARRAMEGYGNVPIWIEYLTISKLYGDKIAQEARLTPGIVGVPIRSGKKKSDCYCLRAEFDKFIIRRKESFYDNRPFPK